MLEQIKAQPNLEHSAKIYIENFLAGIKVKRSLAIFFSDRKSMNKQVKKQLCKPVLDFPI